ncbi:MAG: hypothetical protein JO024_03355 [Candidatus Eremiobacteraeota bacterium]|nr:hypothetical protein [Candidatus Eremiobacteraeota bacterium]MBV9737661.1 hypothetical protein [Candidatus Eremiobacteraeota bacterium]
MAEQNAKPTVAIVATVIWGMLLIPGLLGALLSPMMFDAPGSINNPAAWANMLIIVSFPCLCILSIIGSWIVWQWHKRGATRSSSVVQIVAALLPLLPVAYVVGALVIGTGLLYARHEQPGLHTTIFHPYTPPKTTRRKP